MTAAAWAVTAVEAACWAVLAWAAVEAARHLARLAVYEARRLRRPHTTEVPEPPEAVTVLGPTRPHHDRETTCC